MENHNKRFNRKKTDKLYKFRAVGTIIISNIKPADLVNFIELHPQFTLYAIQRNGFPMTI